MTDNSGANEIDGARLLESVRDALARWLELGSRPRVTVDQWIRLSADEKRSCWAGSVTAIGSFTGWRETADQSRALGQLRYVPAVPVLASLRDGSPVQPVQLAAAHALFSIGTSEARDTLRSGIDGPERFDRFMAAKILFTDEGTAWDNAGWLFADTRLSTAEGLAAASEAMRFLSPRSFSREGEQWWLDELRDLPSRDQRWLDLCVGLRDHDYLGRPARQALKYADPAVTGPALDAAATARNAQARPRSPHLVAGSLAERYQRGDYQGAWQELGVVDPLDDAWRSEAEQVAVLTMQRVRRNAERLVAALIAKGWPVTAEQALPGPTPDIEDRIQRLEQLTGTVIPPALSAFWRMVGPIDLVPRDYWETPFPDGIPEELAVADPLEVIDLSEAWFGVEEWQQKQDRMHPEITGPLEVTISADYLHKANISGGAPYSVWLPCMSADPLVRYEEHALSFTDYLRLAFASKGFTRAREEQERLNRSTAPSQSANISNWLGGVEYERLGF